MQEECVIRILNGHNPILLIVFLMNMLILE